MFQLKTRILENNELAAIFGKTLPKTNKMSQFPTHMSENTSISHNTTENTSMLQKKNTAFYITRYINISVRGAN